MEKYISKSAVVAEIERLISEIYGGQSFDSLSREKQVALWYVKSIMSSIDTLEVKEVDLEKELDEWVKYGPHTSYPWCTIPDAIKITAEHFFELGLKAKGE